MEFGILFTSHPNPASEPYPHREVHARVTAEIQAADTLGYDTAWVAEHHFSTYGYLSRPVQLAAYIADLDTARRRTASRVPSACVASRPNVSASPRANNIAAAMLRTLSLSLAARWSRSTSSLRWGCSRRCGPTSASSCRTST